MFAHCSEIIHPSPNTLARVCVCFFYVCSSKMNEYVFVFFSLSPHTRCCPSSVPAGNDHVAFHPGFTPVWQVCQYRLSASLSARKGHPCLCQKSVLQPQDMEVFRVNSLTQEHKALSFLAIGSESQPRFHQLQYSCIFHTFLLCVRSPLCITVIIG